MALDRPYHHYRYRRRFFNGFPCLAPFSAFRDASFHLLRSCHHVIIRRETRAYSGGDGIVDLLVGFPVPGQEFMEAWIGD
ncbi:hypothetical protein, partial [Brytella acorum]